MATQTDTKPAPTTDQRTKQPHLWNVVLLNDDDHSVEYVVRMMKELFAHPVEKGLRIAKSVHKEGRAVCMTTHKEHAELKRDQIHAFGRDVLVAECRGAMSSIIEPAEFDADDEHHDPDNHRNDPRDK